MTTTPTTVHPGRCYCPEFAPGHAPGLHSRTVRCDGDTHLAHDPGTCPACSAADTNTTGLPRAQRMVLEDLVDRGITPAAVLTRRHRTHIAPLVTAGILAHTAEGIELADEVAALVALGRACGDHDRPLPCTECA